MHGNLPIARNQRRERQRRIQTATKFIPMYREAYGISITAGWSGAKDVGLQSFVLHIGN